jgi:hypothetical protein
MIHQKDSMWVVVSFLVTLENLCMRFKKPNVLLRRMIYGNKKVGVLTHRQYFKSMFNSVHSRWDLLEDGYVKFQVFLLPSKKFRSSETLELKSRIKQVVFVPVQVNKDVPMDETLIGQYPSIFRNKS